MKNTSQNRDVISKFSHEVRTPLSIIKEGVSLVLDEIPGKINDKQRDILKTVMDNIDRLNNAICKWSGR